MLNTLPSGDLKRLQGPGIRCIDIDVGKSLATTVKTVKMMMMVILKKKKNLDTF